MKKIILTILLLVLTFGLGLYFSENIKGWFDKPDNDITDENQDVGNGVISGFENNSVFKLSTRSVSNNGASLDVVASFDEHANVNKLVDWSLSWNGSGNVNEYVSLNVSEDTLTCNVKVLKGFTTQIKLTCTLRSNTNLTAVCNIDYVGRNLELIASNMSLDDYSLNNCTFAEIIAAMQIEYAHNYRLTGGSVIGELRNINVKYIMLNPIDTEFGFVTSNKNDSIYESIRSHEDMRNYSNMSSALYIIQSNEYIYWEISADIYYNNVLIQHIEDDFGGTFNYGQVRLEPTEIKLNESQLIF